MSCAAPPWRLLSLPRRAGNACLAQRRFPDVGEQVPITALINASPWYAGFEAAVALYEDQTGNVLTST